MQRFNETEQCSLMVATLDLLKEKKVPAHVIYAETNLPFYWIKDMMAGKSNGPSVNRIQYLYEYLSEKQLEV